VNTHLQGTFGLATAVMQKVRKIWSDRWSMMDSPIHGVGYCLDPEFLPDSGLDINNTGDACIKDLLTMIKRLLPAEEQSKAHASYMAFRNKEGLFGSDEAMADAATSPGHQWWDMYGVGHPELRKLAIRILAQPSSACACERAWSNYDFIHNTRRNRLKQSRARDLVYVFSNSRLSRKIRSPAGESFIGWEEEEEDSAAE
jgi:hypothetical protein